MKNILLPTDFSNNAFNAMEYAVNLFKDEEYTFHLLNTYTPIAYNVATVADSYSTMMIEEITRKNSENGLEEIANQLMEKYNNPKHVFVKHAALNLFISEVSAMVEEHMVDLIIMGTKGATGAKEIFLGTNTLRTIKNAKCAVIAVPEDFSYEAPKEILFTTDFNFSLENKFLPLLKSICTKHISRLNILNIYWGEPLTAEQEKVKADLDVYFKNSAHLFHITKYANLVEAVVEFQIKFKINFMVMIHNRHSFFENLLFTPVIKRLVCHTSVPFMVIPAHSQARNE